MTGFDDRVVPEGFNFARDVVEPLAADPNRRALTHVDRDGVIQRLTFAQMTVEASRWAWLLRSQGYMPGDRVLVLLGKVPAWLGVMLGAMKGGLITVPCSDMLRARDLAFRVQHSEASLLVADRSSQAEIDAMRGLLDRPVDVLYTDDAALLLQRQPTTAPTEETRSTDYAFLLYTSGTTHDPKGVAHTHAYTWAKRMQAEHWLAARPGDLVWCTAGTGWAKSIWNVLLGPWWRGAEIVLHEGGFDAEERFELIDRLGVTVLCQAPTEYRLMAKSDALENYPLSRLRHAVSAGEPLNPEVIELFHDALGVTIYDGYGQTENTLLVANTRDHDLRAGSMGLPTPGHHVAVIDESGAEVGAGVEGDIALRGKPPSLFARYWNAREETAAAFRGDWYVTGDRAVRDEDGYFWFSGRADDVIISAGYRIGPFEVESALLGHPAVAETAAVAKPDPDRGQLVKAFVVLRPGHEPSDALTAELQEHAKRVTAPYKYPREVEFVSELPKTRSGKIRRSELRAVEAQRANEGERAAATAAVAVTEADRLARVEAEAAARRELEAREAAEPEAHEAEAAARRWAEQEMARLAEEEARAARELEEANRLQREAETRRRDEAERQALQDEADRRKRDAEEQRAAEMQRRAEEDERLRAAAAAQRASKAEERRQAEETRRAEKQQRKEEEARRKREAEAARRVEKQQRKEEEARRKREAEADREAERQRRQVEEEQRTREAQEARAAELERRRDEEERQRAEEERQRAEEAEKRKAETEAKKQAGEDARRRNEEERRRQEEAERLALEEAERRQDAERRGAEDGRGRKRRREPEPAEEPEPASNPALLERLQRYGLRSSGDGKDADREV